LNPYITASAISISKGCIGLVDQAYRDVSASEIRKVLQIFGAVRPEVVKFRAIGAMPSGFFVFDPPFFSAFVLQGIEPTNHDPYLTGLGPQATVDVAGGFHPGIFAAMRAKGFPEIVDRFITCDLQLCTGHSLGGTVAITLASVLGQPGPGKQRGVVTFGSPRPFSGIGPTLKHCTTVIRWIRPFDSITRFPPRGAESLATSTVLANIIGGWPADWYQPEGGRQFNGDGRWTDRGLSQVLPYGGEADLLLWAAGLPSSLSRAHDFLGYAASTVALLDTPDAFWAQSLEKGGMESPSFSNPPIELQRAAAAAGFPLPMTMGCQHGVTASKARHVSPVL